MGPQELELLKEVVSYRSLQVVELKMSDVVNVLEGLTSLAMFLEGHL